LQDVFGAAMLDPAVERLADFKQFLAPLTSRP
jgi:hypothetical protein